MTLIYKINDLESKIPYKQWEALKKEFVEFAKEKKQLETICNNLMDYLDNNKLVLQNPNILDFYIEMKELGDGSNE